MRLVSTLAALTVFSVVISSQTSSGHAVFEQALAKERVEGNLTEAIRLYERVAEFASDRALAARALVRDAPPRTIGQVVWSPDGGRLAFVLRGSQLETWLLENPLALAGAADASARR